MQNLPVAVIGTGPVGLAAAAHLIEKGERLLVLEAGTRVGSNVREWGHVRLFTPWRYLLDSAAARLLNASGWKSPPGERLPTGQELVELYLEPLARLPELEPRILLGQRVVSISRRDMDKVKTAGRARSPFQLLARGRNGREHILLARAVIDASGTWSSPNPLGAGGLPAPGERELEDRIHYGIPDLRSGERSRYQGRRTLVVGSGHSAFQVVMDLTALAEESPDTQVQWAIRRPETGSMFGGGAGDELPARGRLGNRLRELVTSGRVRLETGFRIARLEERGKGVLVLDSEGRRLGPVDRIVATTGFRPDLSPGRELRLSLDPILEAPERLAPLIDPNLHSCGSVPPHGYEELKHPEADFYMVGMKSYGRAPTFLLLTGYEQVRSVVSAIAGDLDQARQTHLVLPETGVCSARLPVPPQAPDLPAPSTPLAETRSVCC